MPNINNRLDINFAKNTAVKTKEQKKNIIKRTMKKIWF